MTYKTVYRNAHFSLIYHGPAVTDDSAATLDDAPAWYKGGHVYQVELAAIATQGNTLIADLPRDAERVAAGGFAIDFDITAAVWQDDAAPQMQGDGTGDVIKVHYSDSDAARIELRRVWCTRGLLINPATGALWHEASLYMLDEGGRVLRFNVLGYVPLAAITHLQDGEGNLIRYDRRAIE